MDLDPIKISSKGKDIIANGTVHTFDSQQLTFKLGQLTFDFEFVVDAEKTPRFQSESLGSQHIKYQLFNFNNTLGSGLREPIKIGTLLSRNLYFIFTTYAFDNDSSKTVHYTFFLE